MYLLTGLSKVYNSRMVLDIPKLEIGEGRIHALLGPNGAGKTTLLEILGFVEFPTSGEIRYCKKKVRFSESQLTALRREIIIVGQHPILFTTTVFKNLEFGLKIRKIPREKRNVAIDEALELVGMRAFSNAPAHRLSGGETQRVALARALALSPKALLCDEPTSSVDAEHQAVITDVLGRINDSKKTTIVFTTHDRSLAANLAHRTMTLNSGKLVGNGYENMYSGNIRPGDDGKYRCVIHPEVALTIPGLGKTPEIGQTRIFIDPDKIGICQENDNHLENTLEGRVCQITMENSKIRITADAGVRFTLAMPETIYRENRIIAGGNIRFFIPPDAIDLAD